MLPRIVVAELSLMCPCNVQSAGLTAITITAGISNSEITTSGDLRMLLGTSPELPIKTRWINAYAYYPGALNSGEEYPQGTNITTAFELPTELSDQDTAIFVLDLQELVDDQWITRDSVRLDPGLEFPKPELGGESVSGAFGPAIHFAGTPSLELLENGQATVRIPSIVNTSQEEIIIATVNIGHFTSGEFWGQSSWFGAKFDVMLAIPGMSSIDNVAITGEYTAPTLDSPFTHIWLRAGTGNSIVVWQTIETRNGEPMPSRNLSATSIDFIADSDGDGVSDYNESVAGTDPFDNESLTDNLTLDVMVLYTPGVAQLYLNEPLARIIQELEWANQAFRNSGIDAKLRLVGLQETNYTKSLDTLTAMRDLKAQAGVFDGIDSARESAGADLVVLFIEDEPEDGICGYAIRAADNKEGDFGFTDRSDVVAVVAADCGASILAHELGHNFGLGHSVREESDEGTYVWSRGHGVDNDFVTIMAFQEDYNTSGPDLQFFSTPTRQCGSSPCGVDRLDQNLGADAALSIRTTMFQVAALSGRPPDIDADGIINFEDSDDDNDGVADGEDAFPLDSSESVDTDSDGTGNNADTDDDNDGMPDTYEAAQGLDPLVDDAAGDIDMDGKTNLEEFQESLSDTTATQYLQTTSTSANITSIHLVNSSGVAQSFTGTLYNGAGVRLGLAGTALSSVATAAKGRLILSSADIETLFSVEPWSGPAMLEVTGTDTFELMAKLRSPSGLVSNTNCVRQDRVLNIEGFNSDNLTFVRFINTTDTAFGAIKGTLYDVNGAAIGTTDTILVSSLAPKEAIFINGKELATLIGAEWDDEAMLEVDIVAGLKLLNLNLVNGETFFNFSCFESSESGRMYLQTTSTSNNVSFTHLVNTSNSAQAFTGTLYNGDGDQLGSASQPLHTGTVPPKGRAILSSGEIETAFSASPWTGPAIVEIQGAGTFEVMTKLTSPSGLISNTNCVRRNQVHNIEPPGSNDKTFVRFINTGATALSDIKGSLYDGVGNVIGTASQTLVASLPAKSAIFLNRDNISDIVGDNWNGAALLEVESPPAELRLLNLNFINSETFFNFSCYEVSQ
jgi:hypothetical protein